ncbi:MAG: hypothetical protein ACJA2X_000673 [Halocynthiibacter sp.]|jgi:hypothetical protein
MGISARAASDFAEFGDRALARVAQLIKILHIFATVCRAMRGDFAALVQIAKQLSESPLVRNFLKDD